MRPHPLRSLPLKGLPASSEQPCGTDKMLCVTVVYSPEPRQVQEMVLEVAGGATAMDVVRASALLTLFPQRAMADLALGVWGHKVGPDHVVQHGDRIEIYRPLRVDPKVARRTRFEAQGARTAGLFARRRPGAKAGY